MNFSDAKWESSLGGWELCKNTTASPCGSEQRYALKTMYVVDEWAYGIVIMSGNGIFTSGAAAGTQWVDNDIIMYQSYKWNTNLTG